MKQQIVDVISASLKYEGSADLGRATSSEFWSIKRTSVSGGVTTVDFPLKNGQPNDAEIFEWDERANLKYSLVDDFTKPTLASAARDSNTQITVTASELLNIDSITKSNDGGFVVSDTATPSTKYAVSSVAKGATADKIVLTVATIAASQATGVTVTYVAGGNGTVQDQANNLLATNSTGVVVAAW